MFTTDAASGHVDSMSVAELRVELKFSRVEILSRERV